MVNKEIKRDFFYLFCSLLFFFAFFFMNNNIKDVQGSKENPNFTIGEEPIERCLPRYEDRTFQDLEGHVYVRCVKIGVPENVYYDGGCEELGLKNPQDYPEDCKIE